VNRNGRHVQRSVVVHDQGLPDAAGKKGAEISAVTHVDGTERLQTVSKRQNPRYWALIKAVDDLTGCPSS
jgi:predicted NodU family carbamoyl transferase